MKSPSAAVAVLSHAPGAAPCLPASSEGWDHRALLRAMDLAHFEERAPGVVFWHPAGARAMRRLEAFVRAAHEQEGSLEVRSPMLLPRALWEQSGHWAKYHDHMYVVPSDSSEDNDAARADGGALALKPMSCPGHILIYQASPRSYRDLPMRLFEFGQVHRRESSGALSGLLRVRAFVQDDSHVVAARHQIPEGVASFVRLVERMYRALGFSEWSYRLALRPAVRAGSDDLWDDAEEALRRSVRALGIDPEEAPGEGAFYGPKLEVHLRDRLGRSWQCGVIQVDFVLPERFDMSFRNSSGALERPVLLHHAVLGSLERMMAVVLEHHGRLPDGLAPEPVRVLPVGAEQEGAAASVADDLRRRGVPARMEADGPLPGRLRDAADRRIPVVAVVGAREAAGDQVMVQPLGGGRRLMQRAAFVDRVAARWHAADPADSLVADAG